MFLLLSNVVNKMLKGVLGWIYADIVDNSRSPRKAKGLIGVMTHVHGKIYNYYKLYQILCKQKRVINLININLIKLIDVIVLKTGRSNAKVESLIIF